MAIDKKINNIFFLIELLIKSKRIKSSDPYIAKLLGCSSRTVDRYLTEISNLSDSLIKVEQFKKLHLKYYEIKGISTEFEKIIKNTPYGNSFVKNSIYWGPKQKAHILLSSEMIQFLNGYIQEHPNFENMLKQHNDGTIEFTFIYMDSIEILPFIKMWIPYLMIKSPQNLKDELEMELKKYLE